VLEPWVPSGPEPPAFLPVSEEWQSEQVELAGAWLGRLTGALVSVGGRGRRLAKSDPFPMVWSLGNTDSSAVERMGRPIDEIPIFKLLRSVPHARSRKHGRMRRL